MRLRSHRPLLVGVLLLASLAAAAPVVRRCPYRWDQIDVRTYAECAAMPHAGDCALPEAPGAECAPMAACPLRTSHAGPGPRCEHCPDRSPAPASHGARHGYCLEEPVMASASRVPVIAGAPAPLVLAVAILAIELPTSVRPLAPRADARPPTPPELARPPIRGPPALLG